MILVNTDYYEKVLENVKSNIDKMGKDNIQDEMLQSQMTLNIVELIKLGYSYTTTESDVVVEMDGECIHISKNDIQDKIGIDMYNVLFSNTSESVLNNFDCPSMDKALSIIETLIQAQTKNASNNSSNHKLLKENEELNQVLQRLEEEIKALKNEKEEILDKFDEMKQLAYMDMNTEVKNANAFNEEFGSYEKDNIVFAIVNVNNLSAINDEYGRDGGNGALYTAAKTFMEKFGANSIYRIMGGQFFVLSDKMAEEVENLLVSIQKELYENTIELIYGIAVGKDFEQLGDIIEAAEENLVKMKYGIKKEVYNIGNQEDNTEVEKNTVRMSQEKNENQNTNKEALEIDKKIFVKKAVQQYEQEEFEENPKYEKEEGIKDISESLYMGGSVDEAMQAAYEYMNDLD